MAAAFSPGLDGSLPRSTTRRGRSAGRRQGLRLGRTDVAVPHPLVQPPSWGTSPRCGGRGCTGGPAPSSEASPVSATGCSRQAPDPRCGRTPCRPAPPRPTRRPRLGRRPPTARGGWHRRPTVGAGAARGHRPATPPADLPAHPAGPAPSPRSHPRPAQLRAGRLPTSSGLVSGPEATPRAWASLTCSGGPRAVDLAGHGGDAGSAGVNVDHAAGGDAIDWSRRAMRWRRSTPLGERRPHAGERSCAVRIDRGRARRARPAVRLVRRCGRPARADGGRRPQRPRHPPAVGADLDGAALDLEASLAAANRGGSFDLSRERPLLPRRGRYRQGRWDGALLLAQLAVDRRGRRPALDGGTPDATAAQPLAARSGGRRAPRRRAGAAREVARRRQLPRPPRSDGGRDLPPGPAWAAELGDAIAAFSEQLEGRFVPWRAGYVEALVSLGRIDDGARFADQLARSSPTPVVRNDTALAALLVAGARGDDQAFDGARRRAWRRTPTRPGPTRAPGSSWRPGGAGAVEVSDAGPSPCSSKPTPGSST